MIYTNKSFCCKSCIKRTLTDKQLRFLSKFLCVRVGANVFPSLIHKYPIKTKYYRFIKMQLGAYAYTVNYCTLPVFVFAIVFVDWLARWYQWWPDLKVNNAQKKLKPWLLLLLKEFPISQHFFSLSILKIPNHAHGYYKSC